MKRVNKVLAALALTFLLQACGSSVEYQNGQTTGTGGSFVAVNPTPTPVPGNPTPSPVPFGTATKYPFILTGDNLNGTQTKGCFTNSSTPTMDCYSAATSNGVTMKSTAITAVSINTDTNLKIRATARAAWGIAAPLSPSAGSNAALANYSCLQYTIKVNGYSVQTKLLSASGQTTCRTFQWNGFGYQYVDLPAQDHDDIDMAPCLGNRQQGDPVTIEIVSGRNEFRCLNYGIGCTIGNLYQTHVAQADILVANDTSVLPAPTTGPTVTRRCDQ